MAKHKRNGGVEVTDSEAASAARAVDSMLSPGGEELIDVTGPVPGTGNGEETAPAKKERKAREVTYTVIGTSIESGLDDHCGEFPSLRRAMQWVEHSRKLLSRFYAEIRVVQSRVKERIKLS